MADLSILAGFLAGTLALSGSAQAQNQQQAPLTIAVQASGALPGFRIEDAAPYLAEVMDKAGIAAWHFAPRDTAVAAPNRIEWTFEVLPYAGGQVRRFFPMPEARGMDVHLQGAHRLITAKVKLYLGGQYQTGTAGEEAVQGGGADPDLGAFLVRLTRALENGYRATDVTPVPRRTP